MRILFRSMEQVSVVLALGILILVGLSFSLSHQLEDSYENRFLFSGIILGITTLYFRFSLTHISALHRAAYRVSVVMMAWAIGLYFFPYPDAIIYWVTLPGFYFLYRIESKAENVLEEDKIAAGILFILAIFLYIQQQPLQILLFENFEFDWQSYYLNAPAMALISLALIRFQFWVNWDGIAIFGTLILIISLSLSLSLIAPAWLLASELISFLILSHLTLLFVHGPNTLYERFAKITGVLNQSLNYAKSIYWLLLILSQICLLLVLLVYLHQPLFARTAYQLIEHMQANNVLVPLFILGLTLAIYQNRRWSVSLVLAEAALVTAFIVMNPPLKSLSLSVPLIAIAFVSSLLIAMLLLKRKLLTKHWIQNWSFVVVLIVYALVFFQMPVFTPLGLIGFIFPVIIWGLLPDRPLPLLRRYEAYFWPLASAILVLCIQPMSINLLSDWALLSISAPLILSLIMLNKQLQDIINTRAWNVLHLWKQDQHRYLVFYAIVSIIICMAHFIIINKQMNWLPVIKILVTLLLSAAAVLYSAIKTKRISLIVLTEFILWLSMILVRWKLETLEVMQIGTAIDGYLFIAVAIITAGIREKMRDHSPHLTTYFIKSSICYSLIGWIYLVYLHLSGGQQLHGELASTLMAAFFYWLSRRQHKSMKILVFVFANIAIFIFLKDQGFNNILLYVTPALGSALLIAQLFKDELTDFQLGQIRLYCGLILLGISAAYNILDFRASVWYPASAALLSSLIVVLGISFRIRIFLYLGSSFIFVNLIGMIANIIITQPPEKTMFAIGLLFLSMGIIFVSSYLLFQIKRDEIIVRYQSISSTIATWD